MDFGTKIKVMRCLRRVGQDVLAGQLGVSGWQISLAENNKRELLPETRDDLCELLGLDENTSVALDALGECVWGK